MNKNAAAICLLLSSCTGTIRPLVADCPNNHSYIRDMVYEGWLDVNVETPNCYSIEFLELHELKETCGTDKNADGCSFKTSQRVYVNSDISYDRQMVVMYHEVGHISAVNRGHLKCNVRPGDDIMCPAGASNGTVPTIRDAMFVKGLYEPME